MSIKGRCCGGGNFSKSSNYINIKGENPKMLSVMRWNNVVLDKEELNSDNWLYISNESEEIKKIN
jgi:hypothetical protein